MFSLSLVLVSWWCRCYESRHGPWTPHRKCCRRITISRLLTGDSCLATIQEAEKPVYFVQVVRSVHRQIAVLLSPRFISDDNKIPLVSASSSL